MLEAEARIFFLTVRRGVLGCEDAPSVCFFSEPSRWGEEWLAHECLRKIFMNPGLEDFPLGTLAWRAGAEACLWSNSLLSAAWTGTAEELLLRKMSLLLRISFSPELELLVCRLGGACGRSWRRDLRTLSMSSSSESCSKEHGDVFPEDPVIKVPSWWCLWESSSCEPILLEASELWSSAHASESCEPSMLFSSPKCLVSVSVTCNWLSSSQELCETDWFPSSGSWTSALIFLTVTGPFFDKNAERQQIFLLTWTSSVFSSSSSVTSGFWLSSTSCSSSPCTVGSVEAGERCVYTSNDLLLLWVCMLRWVALTPLSNELDLRKDECIDPLLWLRLASKSGESSTYSMRGSFNLPERLARRGLRPRSCFLAWILCRSVMWRADMGESCSELQ